MKGKITSLLFACFLFANLQLSAQEVKDSGLWPNGLSAKVLFIDYGTPNSNSDLNISNGLEFAYIRNLSRLINFAIPAKIGVANITSNESKTTFLGIDGHLQFQYFKEGNKIIPYALAGIGYVNEIDGVSNAQIPLGAGLNIKIGEGGYGVLQFEYRKSLEDERDNLQLGIGWHFRLGKSKEYIIDSDGDGVLDKDDNCPKVPGKATAYGCPDKDDDGIPDEGDDCPEIAGFKRFNGCPDTDKDGIPDAKDDCPEESGTKENNGCPDKPADTDGDGIVDTKDDCPEVAGKVNGCPDTDKDGIIDKEDKCPNEYGELEREGCPLKDTDGDGIMDDKDECPNLAGKALLKGCPDSDGDGIADKNDECPNAPGSRDTDGCPDADGDGLADKVDDCPNERGPSKNKGCPEITAEDQETLDIAMRAVRFETGKSSFKAESFGVLEQIVKIMERYPDYNLKISGHTDNVGADNTNLALSNERATACLEYLKARGISSSRLSAKGFGETKPMTTNDTAEGRKLNRRVEFELIFN